MTVLEDRTRCPRGLVTTGRAQPPAPGHRPSLPGATVGTDESFRPAELEEVLPARFITGKAPFQFHESSWVIFIHGPKYYILGLVVANA